MSTPRAEISTERPLRHRSRPGRNGANCQKKSRPADMCGWTGHIQGNLALRVCEPPCGECAVQRQILSPGGYQGEGISVPRMRAEMGPPWSVSFFDTLKPPPCQGGGSVVPQSLKTSALLRPGTPVPGRSGKGHRYGCCSRTLSGPRSSLPASTRSGRRRQILPLCRPAWRS